MKTYQLSCSQEKHYCLAKNCYGQKKERDEDVPMACCDDSEVCEIVGSCVLNLLSNILGKDFVSLYRDDSLYRDNS